MFLSSEHHETAETCRKDLYILLKLRPCEPFDTDLEYDSDADSESENKADSANQEEDKHTELVHSYIPSLDVVFNCHANHYMKTHAELSPLHSDYTRWETSICRAQTELRQHKLKKKAEPPNDTNPGYRFDPFKAIQKQNNDDVYTKRTRQLETEIEQLKALQKRFIKDLPTREATLAKWETDVKHAWEGVLPQLKIHGVPMVDYVITTMKWLHNQGLVDAKYPDMIDIGHFTLTRVLPYSHIWLCMALFYHVYHCTRLLDLWRYVATVSCLYRSYPRLRHWQQSEWRLRTDVLIFASTVWTITGDVAGAAVWWLGLELATHYAEYIGLYHSPLLS